LEKQITENRNTNHRAFNLKTTDETNTMQDDTNTTNMVTPGARLKYIRENLVKLSRSEVSKKHGLSPDTLAAWENEKIQVTEKGLERCIKIYNSENLLVSKEWLLTGEGLSPNFSFDLNRYFKNYSATTEAGNLDDGLLLAREIEYFRSLTNNSITALISNEDMLPLYSRGDHVGGRLRDREHVGECIGKDCIIRLPDGATYIRRIANGKNEGHYNLACLNPHSDDNPEPVIFNVKIESAAPIIWHRRIDEQLS
jgi:DNA-binding transcriptional regulator YiaG